MSSDEQRLRQSSDAETAEGASHLTAGDPAHENETRGDKAHGGEAHGSGRRHRRVSSRAVAAGVVVLAGTAAWWFGTAHRGTDLSEPGGGTTCAGGQKPNDRDLVTGGITFTAPRDLELLSIRLVDPVNITLADALIVPVVAKPGGGATVHGVTRGWPLTDADRATLTLDWAAERGLAGADLRAGVEEAPILHLQVIDSTKDASIGAWQVEYRMWGVRWSSRFDQALRSTAAPCTL
ncbi:MAG TPA: hypothetical protein VGK35_10925 [Actinotalea sp.]|jgi:hypothetical protein